MKEASKRFFDIAGSHPNALLRAAVDYQPPPPTHFIRHQPKLYLAAADRSRPGRRNGNRPVTVSGDILCRDDTLQESSIGHVTRRRHSHGPSGCARGNFLVGFSLTLPTRTGARVCGIDIFYPLHVASGKQKKKPLMQCKPRRQLSHGRPSLRQAPATLPSARGAGARFLRLGSALVVFALQIPIAILVISRVFYARKWFFH
ncbi:hypothetical protein EVAR_61220_1 [Eumeta japonica]|uniref:Uncharacterized protein n=1 Tax=Eumeta variegata TaxID=151549 RepID=A0A4C1Z4S5_EUMVA|nr:hypothetical protein EVAR_61220_1 [Eumeta japonica]